VPLRLSVIRPRFVGMSGLPRVDDAVTASCTMVVYLVRRFESPKDTERQLGPICIIETSYRGSSHTYCPGRMVVALEDTTGYTTPAEHVPNGELGHDGALGSSGSSGVWAAAGASCGMFGSDVAERLRQRGVDLPVISLEKRSAGRHRWLVHHISEILSSRSRAFASTNAMTNLLCTDGAMGASASTDAAADTDRTVEIKPPQFWESTGPSPTLVTTPIVAAPTARPPPVPAAPAVTASTSGTTQAPSNGWQTWPAQAPRDRPTTAEVAAITSALKAAGVPANGGREAPEGGQLHHAVPALFSQAAARLDHLQAQQKCVAESPAPVTRTSSTGSAMSASVPVASPSTSPPTVATPSKVTESVSHAPVEAQVLTRADVEAAAAEAFAAARAVPEAVDVRAATEAADAARAAAEAFQAAEAAAAGFAEQCQVAAQKGPTQAPNAPGGAPGPPAPPADIGAAGEEETDTDSTSIAAPIVQVGESRFCLPRPEVAVQRIAELWRPGAAMVVITTQHYGTPLLCPDGDIMKGLVNIAPSAEGGQQLVPLFWQNIEEVEQEEANGLDGPAGAGGGAGGLAGQELPSSGVLRMSRSSQLQKVEEEEEDEEG